MIHLKETYRGCLITESDDRGGKAGRGRNLTSSLQIRSEDPWFFRYIRYPARQAGAKAKALVKSKARIDKFLDEHSKTRSR